MTVELIGDLARAIAKASMRIVQCTEPHSHDRLWGVSGEGDSDEQIHLSGAMELAGMAETDLDNLRSNFLAISDSLPSALASVLTEETRSIFEEANRVATKTQSYKLDHAPQDDSFFQMQLLGMGGNLVRRVKIARESMQEPPNDNPPTQSEMIEVAGIGSDKFRAIRTEAGIVVSERGGAAANRKYSRSEVRAMIRSVKESARNDRMMIAEAWEPWAD